MRHRKIIKTVIISSIGGFFLLLCLFTHTDEKQVVTEEIHTSGAGLSMDAWVFERSYPFDHIPVSKLTRAYSKKRATELQKSDDLGGQWESLGPKNIAGRTLCLAFHPANADILYAGSAGGGLWKTESQGIGEDAWQRVPTGFPILAIASIAIDPSNPDVMYIGTGETYGAEPAEPGIVNRKTRGTYGIGILKTTDGGATWSQVLTFEQDQIKGVQDLVIDAQNPSEIFAATSDGVFRSTDAGLGWTLVLDLVDCIDIELDPVNPDVLYVSQGNFNTTLSPLFCGIFKSTDNGDSFNELVGNGLLGAWSGNAKLVIDPIDPQTIYASLQVGWGNGALTTPGGLYRSSNGGLNWTDINDQNVAFWQGWYSHDIDVNPNDPAELMYVGIDAWKSTNTGANFTKKTSWQLAPFGELPVDQPNAGSPTYIHGDIHAVYYHPTIANKIFFATDGGVFSTSDGGETFEGLNGGLQTLQFYADMASSVSDSSLCIAGAQDNATYVYKGTPNWWRVIGGDGMSTAIRPDNDSVVFGSYQGLQIQKSNNRGSNFFGSAPIMTGGDYTAFNAPFGIAPTDNDIMYAGASRLYRSELSGSGWAPTSTQLVDGGNIIIKIAISPVDYDVVLIATSPDPINPVTSPKVLKSIDGGVSFSPVNGLPDRVCKDIEYDPVDPAILFATFSGFGTAHIYTSIDGGENWEVSDSGMPDLPTNCIAFDPTNSNSIYAGNDIGVYYSEDAGQSWVPFCENLPEATMVIDLNVSHANNKLRVATHGHGMYERPFVSGPTSVSELAMAGFNLSVYPNPATDELTITFDLEKPVGTASIDLYDLTGRRVVNIHSGALSSGTNRIFWNEIVRISSGTYILDLNIDGTSSSKKIQLK